jgi:hypothetical protein
VVAVVVVHRVSLDKVLVAQVEEEHMFSTGQTRHHYHQLLELQWVRREQQGRVREGLEV